MIIDCDDDPTLDIPPSLMLMEDLYDQFKNNNRTITTECLLNKNRFLSLMDCECIPNDPRFFFFVAPPQPY